MPGRRKAVAPVPAHLMMIAVAVAMAVIIFVWSQGFLSQASSAAGGQQSQQDVAAQSSVSIDAIVFGAQNSDSGTATVTVVVRNVGFVSVTLGSLALGGAPGNGGLQTAILCSTFSSTSEKCSVPTSPAVDLASSGGTSGTSGMTTIAKGSSTVLTLTWTAGTSGVNLHSGDAIAVKVATTVGTFAAQQTTVP